MNLTLDHVDIFTGIKDMSQNVLQALLPILADCAKQTTPRLVVSGILSGATSEAIFDIGTLVSTINDQPCQDLLQLREALMKPVEGANGKFFFTLKTASGEFFAVPLMEGLLEEFSLSNNYHYPISALHGPLVALLSPSEQDEFQNILIQLAGAPHNQDAKSSTAADDDPAESTIPE